MVLAETSDVAPTLTFVNSTWYLWWIGRSGDHRVNVLSSIDGGGSFGNKDEGVPVTSFYRPAIVANGVWFLAWTRPQDNAIGLLVSKSDSKRFVNELSLTVQSAGGLSMTTFDDHVLLAWLESGGQSAIHLAMLT